MRRETGAPGAAADGRASNGLSPGWRVVDCCFFFQAEDGIRDLTVTGVQTCALPICARLPRRRRRHRLAGDNQPRRDAQSVGPGKPHHWPRGWFEVPALYDGLQQADDPDRKSVVVGKEGRSRWSPYRRKKITVSVITR